MKRRRGRLVALASAAAGLGLLVAGVLSFRDALVDWWYRIPVTRTWGDLLAEKPIELEGGVKVRLGIESLRCPRGSGVLIYCLAEGTTLDHQEIFWTNQHLGPVRLQTGPGWDVVVSEVRLSSASFVSGIGGPVLFARNADGGPLPRALVGQRPALRPGGLATRGGGQVQRRARRRREEPPSPPGLRSGRAGSAAGRPHRSPAPLRRPGVEVHARGRTTRAPANL
ncbi:MAG: hypothetical protein O7J95_12950, partial [Planctomycetota bacterium]|nr:hypothetical protein [Planctomycetota bacterium]